VTKSTPSVLAGTLVLFLALVLTSALIG